MRVSEAVKRWADVLGKEIEIEGIAEISNSFSVIYEEEERINRKVGDSLTPGILVYGNQLKTIAESLPKPISALGGSEISYLVKVQVSGIVTNTGYSFAPLKLGHIYEIEFNDEYTGLQKLTLNTHLVNISFKPTRTLRAAEIRKFKSYFPSFVNLVELKKYLECGENLFLIKRVTEDDIHRHVELLKQVDAYYELSESPIEYGFLGMP